MSPLMEVQYTTLTQTLIMIIMHTCFMNVKSLSELKVTI